MMTQQLQPVTTRFWELESIHAQGIQNTEWVRVTSMGEGRSLRGQRRTSLATTHLVHLAWSASAFPFGHCARRPYPDAGKRVA